MAETRDPIDAVRAARHAISERFGHDPAKVVEHYMVVQQELRARLLAPAPSGSPRSSEDQNADVSPE